MDRRVNTISFNQDYSCFVTAMNTGIRIFNTDPLVSNLTLSSDVVGSIQVAEMLSKSNLMAVVGGGPNPKFHENSVVLLDCAIHTKNRRAVVDISFTQPVISVKVKENKLVVVLRNEVHVFNFPNKIERLNVFTTRDNPRGICDICSTPNFHLLAFPGQRCGSVQIVDLNQSERTHSMSPNSFTAHSSELAVIALNKAATLIATASRTGTLIRIFEAATKNKLTEFRRGVDCANVYCLSFSDNSQFLCVSSDKCTVHIFAVRDTLLNKRSTFKHMSNILGPYVDSQWCLASFSVPIDYASMCAFTSTSSVVAVSMDGSYQKYAFNNDGLCNREVYDVYSDVEDENDF